ncbi:unnamed protein product, partial [Didymodactylos carnosus]
MKQLNYIDEFEEWYDPMNAIFWYTRDTFLFRLLNKALREQDVNTLYSLRYFIKDLHLQLKQLHASQQQTSTTLVTAYRGQLMNNEEFDKKIRRNKGGFLSVKTFLSTTLDRNLTNFFAGDGSKEDEAQSVLFQIDIDKNVIKFPFADVSEESQFGKDEREVLFTMGCVFLIESAKEMTSGFWIVQLKLTSEEDEQLQKLTLYMKDYIIKATPLYTLGSLLTEMGQYYNAEHFYLQVLEEQQELFNCNKTNHVPAVYNDLGLIHILMDHTNIATDYYEKSLEAHSKNGQTDEI